MSFLEWCIFLNKNGFFATFCFTRYLSRGTLLIMRNFIPHILALTPGTLLGVTLSGLYAAGRRPVVGSACQWAKVYGSNQSQMVRKVDSEIQSFH